MRVVLDTVVFVRSLINPFSRCGRIVFDHYQRYQLHLSRPVLEEILEVLQRPELTARFRSLPGLDFQAVIGLLAQAEMAEVGELPPLSRDPKDDKFLATAEAAAANYLVSEDEDLRVLGEYQGTQIVNCQEFLTILEQGADGE